MRRRAAGTADAGNIRYGGALLCTTVTRYRGPRGGIPRRSAPRASDGGRGGRHHDAPVQGR